MRVSNIIYLIAFTTFHETYSKHTLHSEVTFKMLPQPLQYSLLYRLEFGFHKIVLTMNLQLLIWNSPINGRRPEKDQLIVK